MHLPLPGSAAARLRVATALAALSLLVPGCASPVPAPAGPAVVTPSVTDSPTPVASVAVSPAAATSAPAAPPAAPPPGATAECKDGTYSFSKHHSGTCSSHGGVKRWL